jgi:hypothetical protein
MLFCPLTALADAPPDTFASGTVALLDREPPQMNKAVAERIVAISALLLNE